MFKTEEISEHPRALIISRSNTPLADYLRRSLQQKKVKVSSGLVRAEKLKDFQYIFIIDPEPELLRSFLRYIKKGIIIFTSSGKKFLKAKAMIEKNDPNRFKIVLVLSDFGWEQMVDRILWFFFSKTSTSFLRLGIDKRGKVKYEIKLSIFKDRLLPFFTKKNIFRFLFLLIISVNILIWILAGAAVAGFYKGYLNLDKAKAFLNTSSRLYFPFRPVYHFLFIGQYADAVQNFAQTILNTAEQAEYLREDLTEFMELFYGPDMRKDEIVYRKELFAKIKERIKSINRNLQLLESNQVLALKIFSEQKKDIRRLSESIKSFLAFVDNFELIFPKSKRKYLVFFANNMELRPGGGFLGSFAIIETKELGVEKIRFYDVYDADGQLQVNIKPPEPIEKYLGKEYWFLRDSNFSPDTAENFQIAKEFLRLELNEDDIDGMIVFTVSAFEKVLTAFDSIYLPDFGDRITAENFYTKTQFYVHEDFFPGSIRKKSFIKELFDQLLAQLEFADKKRLITALAEAFDEKFIVMYFEDKRLQQVFDRLYWSGRMLRNRCLIENQENCIPDFIFPVEANLGVNKTNFYVRSRLDLEVFINSQGQIERSVQYLIANRAQEDIFLGGDYRNYLRFFLPANVKVEEFLIDGKRESFSIGEYDSDIFKDFFVLERFVVIPKSSERRISFSYRLPQKLTRGRNIYQLIVQKQIGSRGFNMSLKLKFAENIRIITQNFNAVVKDNALVYNSYLSGDKVFLIEVFKE